jgi:hypothetical protein
MIPPPQILPSPGGRGDRGGGNSYLVHPPLHPVEYVSLLHRASPLPKGEGDISYEMKGY